MSHEPRRVAIRGGRLIDGNSTTVADVLVDGGTIAAIGRGSIGDVDLEIDARGSYVLPGGVDAHVHFQTPSDGTHTTDSFSSGSTAAAFGGTTTALQFAVQDRGESLVAAVLRWRELLAASPSFIDVGFHLMITDFAAPERLDELRSLVEMGVTSFKVFMSGENAIRAHELFRTMQIAAELGARVMVHAEDGASIDVLAAQALAAGRLDPIEHARTRPAPTEAIAVYRAIEYARMTGASVYFVHLSSAAAVAHVAHARAEGLPIDGETCPQYLFFDESILRGTFEESAPYLFTPPPRAEDDRDALWAALESGVLSTVASDHGGYCLHEKVEASDFAHVPQGILGIETRLSLLHTLGIRTGRLSWARFVELTATAPARLFGVGGRKGTIEVGADADIVVFDPDSRHAVSRDTHHSAHDYNPYEGVELTGAVTHTLVGGRLLVDQGSWTSPRPSGRFLPRSAAALTPAS